MSQQEARTPNNNELAMQQSHLSPFDFNIRTGSDLHRRVAIAAKQKGINLNKLVNEALEQYLKSSV